MQKPDLALKVGERMVEEVHEIKSTVVSYFTEHFSGRSWLRPQLVIEDFLHVSALQNEGLVSAFS